MQCKKRKEWEAQRDTIRKNTIKEWMGRDDLIKQPEITIVLPDFINKVQW
ncbi:MAG: hypothetical protein H8D23_36310 [Candidatus Brocadiales bacterium]|nr:hypothetical protein [Candidatus Brocadiales bacterium]